MRRIVVIEHSTCFAPLREQLGGLAGARSRGSGVGRPNANPKSKIQNPKSHPRHGLTLLEVILALAILGLALAAITQLISIGARAARESRDLTRAQIIAESILSELTVEALPLETIEGLSVPHEPDWMFSTLVEGTDEPGMIAVHVVVEHVDPPDGQPLRFIVTRWFVDPDLVAEGEEASLEPTGADL